MKPIRMWVTMQNVMPLQYQLFYILI